MLLLIALTGNAFGFSLAELEYEWKFRTVEVDNTPVTLHELIGALDDEDYHVRAEASAMLQEGLLELMDDALALEPFEFRNDMQLTQHLRDLQAEIKNELAPYQDISFEVYAELNKIGNSLIFLWHLTRDRRDFLRFTYAERMKHKLHMRELEQILNDNFRILSPDFPWLK